MTQKLPTIDSSAFDKFDVGLFTVSPQISTKELILQKHNFWWGLIQGGGFLKAGASLAAA